MSVDVKRNRSQLFAGIEDQSLPVPTKPMFMERGKYDSYIKQNMQSNAVNNSFNGVFKFLSKLK